MKVMFIDDCFEHKQRKGVQFTVILNDQQRLSCFISCEALGCLGAGNDLAVFIANRTIIQKAVSRILESKDMVDGELLITEAILNSVFPLSHH